MAMLAPIPTLIPWQSGYSACNALKTSEGDSTEAAWLRVHPAHTVIFPGEKGEIEISCALDRRGLKWMSIAPPFQGCPTFQLRSLLVISYAVLAHSVPFCGDWFHISRLSFSGVIVSCILRIFTKVFTGERE